jgi:hypothetical protein
MRHRNHLFVPLSWLEREYPDWKELYDRMRANVEKFVANETMEEMKPAGPERN